MSTPLETLPENLLIEEQKPLRRLSSRVFYVRNGHRGFLTGPTPIRRTLLSKIKRFIVLIKKHRAHNLYHLSFYERWCKLCARLRRIYFFFFFFFAISNWYPSISYRFQLFPSKKTYLGKLFVRYVLANSRPLFVEHYYYSIFSLQESLSSVEN